jgi:diguanylate cyclase (GGDEF)-like protein
MGPSKSGITADRYAAQRARGFRLLRFEPDLEAEYRKAYTDVIIPRTRIGGTLGVLAILLFVFVDQMLGVDYSTPGADGVLIGICVPAAGFPLVASFYPAAHKYLLQLSAIGVLGVGFGVLYTLIAARQLGTWAPYESLMLIIVYIYFVSGLLFHQAIFCGTTVLLAFAFTNVPLQTPQLLLYEVLHLFLANVVGGIGLYLLDHQTRMEFLLKRELHHQALVDSLTGLMNRRAFDAHFEIAWRQAQRELTSIGLLILDLDDFKKVNDTCGHQFGDDALRHVAGVLKTTAVRPLDGAGRQGGDEFAVIWYGVDGGWFAQLAKELPLRIEGMRGGDPPVDITCSGGAVIVWPRPGVEMRDAYKAADEKLYQMKKDHPGKIGFVVLQPPPEREQHAA